MGKALGTIIEIAAIVAAIAVNVIPGVGQVLSAAMIAAITTAGVSSAIGLAMSAFTKTPKASAATANRLQSTINLRTPRVSVFGHTAMANDIRDEEYTGTNQEFFHRFYVCAAHKVTSIEEIWFDDKQAWTSASGVTSTFAGYLTVDAILEGSAANAINISSRMGTTRRYTGCAYVHCRFKLTGNSKSAQSPFSSTVPTRLTIIGKGMLVYDPRFDSTVAGGSGPMRAADQTTWAYTQSGVDCGRNPACQLLTYMLGWRIQNPVTSAWKLSVGKAIAPARIDLTSFITGANLCDEAVTLAAGGTEPRYRGDGVVDESEGPLDVVNFFKATMNALVDDADGQMRLLVLHNDLSDPGIPSFHEADVIGQFAWNPEAPLDQDFNVVRGTFVDPSTTSLYQQVDYPQVSLTSIDGLDRPTPLNLSMVQSASQAQRLAKQWLERAQFPGTFSADFQSTAWRVMKGDVIKFTFYPLAFVNKLFRVMETTGKINGVVPIVLREENAAIYAWDRDESPAVIAASPTVYNPLNSPIVRGIDEVSHTVLKFNRSAAQPSTPTGDSPAGWSDGIPSGTDTLWEIVGQKDGTGALLGVWSTPNAITTLNPRFAYDAAVSYFLNNIATFEGGTYLAIQDNFSGQAPSGTAEATAYWAVFAAPGAAGTPGTPPSGFSATINLTSGAAISLRTIADANGYTGASDATITFNVPNGVVARGLSGAGLGIDSGTWPTGSYTITLALVVQSGGIVDGGGGVGGTGDGSFIGSGSDGGLGGDAIYCRVPMSVTINSGGTVRAGGGGGAGGDQGFSGSPNFDTLAGGGGGGGAPNGAGGAHGSGGAGSSPATDGSAGTTSGGGSGGVGEIESPAQGGHGGTGGTFGASGSTFGSSFVGGVAGYAVRKNGNAVTVTNSGTMTGTAA